MRVRTTCRSARLARERRMKDQRMKRMGNALNALPHGLRRAWNWTQRQVKRGGIRRGWIIWLILVTVAASSLLVISSTHLANMQNAISGSAQLSSAHGVSGRAIAGGDPLAPMALTQYVNPFVGSDWAGRSFGCLLAWRSLARTLGRHPRGRSIPAATPIATIASSVSA